MCCNETWYNKKYAEQKLHKQGQYLKFNFDGIYI